MRKILCLCMVTALCLILCSCASYRYEDAMSLYEAGDYEKALVVFEALDDYEDSRQKAAECELAIRYQDAVALMDAGSYEEALAAFKDLGDYEESLQKATECGLEIRYQDAVALMDAGNYEDALAVFEVLEGYRDSAALMESCYTTIMDGKYRDAVAMMEQDPVQAFELLMALDGYSDSELKADSLYEHYAAEMRKTADVGDYILFGAYEQDNNYRNSKEYIEWLVLDKKEDKILVISRYGLDCQWYNEAILKPVTWYNCSLRKWLNESFLKTAFSSTERSAISGYRQDSVFLLSFGEVARYFNEENSRECKPTDYAISVGAYTESDSGIGYWWVRGDECTTDHVGIFHDNSIILWDVDKMHTFYRNVCVRPAMWLRVEP